MSLILGRCKPGTYNARCSAQTTSQKDVKSGTYCSDVINSMSRGIALAKTSTTHYYAQLGILDNGCAIKGLVACYVVWLGSIIYWKGLWTSAICMDVDVGRMFIEDVLTPHRYNTIITLSHSHSPLLFNFYCVLFLICNSIQKQTHTISVHISHFHF